MMPPENFPYFRNGLSGVEQTPLEAGLAKTILADTIDAPEGYIASPELAHAVNVALLLGKPLLLTGPPGTGKTQLAGVIAESFRNDGRPLPLHKFETKSVSVARDLFYTYDAISAFRDRKEDRDARWFITYQALGLAILEAFGEADVKDVLPQPTSRHTHSGPRRSVVLIDEIDKAPRDFPNDLLNEIDRMFFRVPELGRGTPGADDGKTLMDAAHRPIVVITSNDERSLPEPFLRRCVYFHIEPPRGNALRDIVERRLPHIFNAHGTLVEEAVRIFEDLKETRRLQGSFSTAELLDWIQVLAIRAIPDSPLTEQRDVILSTLPALIKTESALEAARREFGGT